MINTESQSLYYPNQKSHIFTRDLHDDIFRCMHKQIQSSVGRRLTLGDINLHEIDINGYGRTRYI